MAITRSSKMNNFVEGVKKQKMKKKKQEPKGKNKNIAAKLHSDLQKETDKQETQRLLKHVCRPFSICVTRIDRIAPIQLNAISERVQTVSAVKTDLDASIKSQMTVRKSNRTKKNDVQPIDAINLSNEPVQKVCRVKKATNVKSVKVPSLHTLTESAFEKELAKFHESNQELNINDPVIARMKGYPPWPGRIQHFSSNKKSVCCYFFGTHNSGPVGSKNIVPYGIAKESVRLVLLRSPDSYAKGIKELEIEYAVPANLSRLNELNPIN